MFINFYASKVRFSGFTFIRKAQSQTFEIRNKSQIYLSSTLPEEVETLV